MEILLKTCLEINFMENGNSMMIPSDLFFSSVMIVIIFTLPLLFLLQTYRSRQIPLVSFSSPLHMESIGKFRFPHLKGKCISTSFMCFANTLVQTTPPLTWVSAGASSLQAHSYFSATVSLYSSHIKINPITVLIETLQWYTRNETRILRFLRPVHVNLVMTHANGQGVSCDVSEEVRLAWEQGYENEREQRDIGFMLFWILSFKLTLKCGTDDLF